MEPADRITGSADRSKNAVNWQKEAASRVFSTLRGKGEFSTLSVETPIHKPSEFFEKRFAGSPKVEKSGSRW
jgi:hypothetical protein